MPAVPGLLKTLAFFFYIIHFECIRTWSEFKNDSISIYRSILMVKRSGKHGYVPIGGGPAYEFHFLHGKGGSLRTKLMLPQSDTCDFLLHVCLPCELCD